MSAANRKIMAPLGFVRTLRQLERSSIGRVAIAPRRNEALAYPFLVLTRSVH
jgi:hypothetical protein